MSDIEKKIGLTRHAIKKMCRMAGINIEAYGYCIQRKGKKREPHERLGSYWGTIDEIHNIKTFSPSYSKAVLENRKIWVGLDKAAILQAARDRIDGRL